MQVSVSQQVYVFFVMALVGMGSGILFDLFRTWRRLVRSGQLSTGISDMLYWIAVGGGTFYTIYSVNNGELRWFELMGMMLGALIYFLALSHLFMSVFGTIAGVLAKIVLLILKIVLTPFLFLYRMIKRPILWVIGPVGKGFRKAGVGVRRTGRKVCRGIKRFRLVSKKS